MKAAILKGKGRIELGERPYPIIKDPTDAIGSVIHNCVPKVGFQPAESQRT